MKIRIDYDKNPDVYSDAKQVIYFVDVNELIPVENIIGKTILSFEYDKEVNSLIIELGEYNERDERKKVNKL